MRAAVREPCRMKGSSEPRLECWTCNRTRLERLTGKWVKVVDFANRRKLAFCSQECHDKALTKTGFYRKLKPRVR